MIISSEQKDSLLELINIGFGRAAASLSELTGQRVLLNVPQIVICSMEEIRDHLKDLMQGKVATVHQMFSGAVAGEAILLMDYGGAILLSGLLSECRVPVDRLDQSDQEVLTEVGNILLNACLGTFGNLLNIHLSFSLPRMQVETLGPLMDSFSIGEGGVRYAMLILTTFSLRDSTVHGYLILVLAVASLDLLVQSLERLG
ncbi:MAG: chemotaxis protein CheC [Desulfobaccales bacterium]